MDKNSSLQIDRHPLRDTPISILGQEVGGSMNFENYSPSGEMNQLEHTKNYPAQKSMQNIGSKNVPYESNPQIVAVKEGSNKKKWIIGICAFLIVGAIIGGVLGYKLSTENTSKGFEEKIKIPINYGKFKESIHAGQEKNLVELIFVPKSQKIYEYKLYNNQTTTQGDGKKKVTNSLIVHTLGLVCANVTKDEFQMFIYIMDTKMYENGNLSNSIVGFPDVLEMEKRAGFRNLKKNTNEPDVHKEASEFMEQQSTNSVQNEYAPLTDEEIGLLAQKGISAEQFYQSRYPIIYFVLDKESKVKLIHQPINLRSDIFQIYLNIIEQVTPIVKSDFYKIAQKDGTKKRMLSQYTQRILSGEEVKPILKASVDENGQANLNKQYEQNKVNSNDSEQSQSYNQSSVIQNGALLESSAKSDFKIADNKVDENGDMPLFKGIEMNSECKIAFVKQEDELSDELFLKIKTTFDFMSVLVQTQEEALNTYNAVFNTSTSNGNSHSDIDGVNNRRMLAGVQGNSLGPAIQKPIFRKNVASFEFGADVRSECQDSGFIGKEDICTVGLYSFFNGATIKIVEKQTRVNVSKILKYYQYIQHLMKDKLDIIKDKVNGRLTTIQKDLISILDQLEDIITIQKNPVLKEIYDVVYNDELQVFNLISSFETFVDTASRNIIKLIKDPFNVLKERLFEFLSEQGIHIENQVNYIQSFVVDRLTKIKKIIELAQTAGLPNKVYEQIFATLDNLEDILIQVVDEPVKKYLDEVEAFILEQTNTMFSSINEVDKSISSLNQSNEIPNKLKKLIGTSSIVDTLKSFINKTVKSISQQFDLSDMLSTAMKKSIGIIKQDIYNQIEALQNKFPNSNNALSNPEIDNLLNDFQNIMDFSLDLSSGIRELKSDVLEIVSSIKKLQEKSALKMIVELSEKIADFPTYLLKALVEQGKHTIKLSKDVGEQMKENILNWKDELVIRCKKLLADIQDIYTDVKGFLKNTDFPEEDPNYYKNAIFDEVKDIFTSVKEIVNYNYDTIGDTFKRFSQIPDKFKAFINDLKALGDRTMNYFQDIKLSITTIYIDQKDSWGSLRSLFENGKEQIRSEIQVTIETEYNQQLNRKAIPEIQTDINSLINKDLAAYKDNIQDNNFSVENLYKDLINQLIISAEFEKIIDSPPLQIPFEYVYMYPTPIGITLKLRLYASWDSGLRFKLGFKNAILDIGAGVNTKVTIGGEVSASVFVAEVGGYAEGVFLDTSLMFGVNLKVLEKFKGSFYIDATFSPYNIKLGLFYKTIFSLQVFKCATERRHLGVLSAIGGFLKKTVGAILSNSSNPIAKAINKAINCLATLEITQKRNDIFEPINIKGETYKKRLYEVEFGALQKL